jgi:tetratricopeptide (TPR) repeat protein
VGCACRDLGRIVEAAREFGVGLALFEPGGPHDEEPGLVRPIYVSLSAWCAEAYASVGDFPRAFAAARDALRVATNIQHPASLAVANDFLGYVHLLHGELHAALPFLDRAVTIATEQDLAQATVRNSSHLAYTLVLLGERERALGCLARALERWAGAIVSQQLGYRTMTASVYLAAGCLEEAGADIRRGLAEATERDARGFLAPLLRLEGEVLAPREPARAQERLEEALALATELGMLPEMAHCHLGLGKLHRHTGNGEQTRKHLTIATSMYREMDVRFWLSQAEIAMSELA